MEQKLLGDDVSDFNSTLDRLFPDTEGKGAVWMNSLSDKEEVRLTKKVMHVSKQTKDMVRKYFYDVNLQPDGARALLAATKDEVKAFLNDPTLLPQNSNNMTQQEPPRSNPGNNDEYPWAQGLNHQQKARAIQKVMKNTGCSAREAQEMLQRPDVQAGYGAFMLGL
ncbi:hypothetical protein CBS101457_003033 [Exobasidium rhododendri]|nr:hypothetical protein CBS101457_003033 [Exobasidium rhododendri]